MIYVVLINVVVCEKMEHPTKAKTLISYGIIIYCISSRSCVPVREE